QERLQSATRRFHPSACTRRNWPEAIELCRVLREEAEQLIAALPLLKNWFSLGHAIGLCYSDLWGAATVESLPHLPQLLNTAAALPAVCLTDCELLRQLASSHPDGPEAQLMASLPSCSFPEFSTTSKPSKRMRLKRPSRPPI